MGYKHVWIDGPDGSKYHCPICGISRCEDHGRFDTCESFIKHRGMQIEKGYKTFEMDNHRWEEYLKKHYSRKYEEEQKGFINRLLNKMRDKLNGL